MRNRLPSRVLGFLATAFLLGLIAPLVGCDDTENFTLPPPFFVPSGTAATPDVVRLVQGPTSTGDSIEVSVVIGGQTTSSDLYSFVFDLQLADPTFLEYIDASAAAGDALEGPTPLVEAAQVGDRVVVGVTKYVPATGNGIPAGERTIVTLRFRASRDGASTLKFVGGGTSAALDSAGSVVGSVGFDSVAATISR